MIGARLNFEQVRTYVLTRIHNDKQKPYAQGLYEQTNCFSVEHELNVLRKISKSFFNEKTSCKRVDILLPNQKRPNNFIPKCIRPQNPTVSIIGIFQLSLKI